MRTGWEIKKLGEVCKTSSGGTPLKSQKNFYLNGTIPWLLSGEVSQGEIFASKNHITNEGLKNSSAKLFPPETVLVAMYGATAGQVGILKIEASTNQAVCGILPSKDVMTFYLYYFFLSIKENLISQATGNAQPNISQIKIRETLLPIPTLSEQERIVAILDEAFAAIDQAKENLEKNIQNAKDLFQSELNAIFSQKGEGWVAKRLCDIFEFNPKKKEARDLLDDDDLVSFLPMEDLGKENEEIALTKERFFKDVHASYTYFANGDVLLAKITPCFENGKIGIAHNLKNGIGFGSSEYIVFRSKQIVNAQLLLYFLSRKSFKEEGAKLMTGAVGHKRVSKDWLENFEMPFPESFIEQKNIIDRIDQISLNKGVLIQSYIKKSKFLDELKKSILNKAFSGELTASQIETAL